LLILNQVILFHGCFAIYCLLAGLPHTGIIAFLLVVFGKKSSAPVKSEVTRNLFKEINSEIQKQNSPTKKKVKKPAPIDPLKQKGDQYERYIGQQFAAKGDLVIYNGFIKGYEDQGVDIISISSETKVINLVQCKNWTKMRMTLAHMNDIYSKLEQYDFDCFQLASYEIEKHTQYPDLYPTLHHAKDNLANYTVRKTLYIASEKVVDLEVGPYLTMMSGTIFKFKDMKIVMKKSA